MVFFFYIHFKMSFMWHKAKLSSHYSSLHCYMNLLEIILICCSVVIWNFYNCELKWLKWNTSGDGDEVNLISRVHSYIKSKMFTFPLYVKNIWSKSCCNTYWSPLNNNANNNNVIIITIILKIMTCSWWCQGIDRNGEWNDC